jgi:uncharacterized protein YcaQ
MPPPTLDDLRRFAVARTFAAPSTLGAAIRRLGYVQMDPIRAPARAQDLILRQRVHDYRVGDLERRYPRLAVEEDFFINYGVVTRDLHELMHPRVLRERWTPTRWREAREVLAAVRACGEAHPRQVDAMVAHGRARTWFGGQARASTQLLDGLHHRGLLRVARREAGVRIYAPSARLLADPNGDWTRLVPRDGDTATASFDRLLDTTIAQLAPLPAATLGQLASHLLGGVPQWRHDRAAAIQRARARCSSARVDGVDWVWPRGESPCAARHRVPDRVRLLAPFDPLVWDRRRFELLWGWAYRFEAYTPASKRRLGYYALPMLWRDRVIGWANATTHGGRLEVQVGHVAGRPPGDAAFRRELDAEVERLRAFLAD